MMDAVYKVITDLVIRLATRCLSILTGGKELCIEESFETSVVVDQKDHFLPISVKNESNTEINERFADLHHLSHPFRQAPQPPSSDATENILDLLQYKILKDLSRFPVGLNRIHIISGRARLSRLNYFRLSESDLLTGEKLEAELRKNRYFGKESEKNYWKRRDRNIPVPPGTELSIAQEMDERLIHLKSPEFFSAEIKITCSGPGEFGAEGALPEGLDHSGEIPKNYLLMKFHIYLKAHINKWHFQSNKSKEYKKWLQSLFGTIRGYYSDQNIKDFSEQDEERRIDHGFFEMKKPNNVLILALIVVLAFFLLQYKVISMKGNDLSKSSMKVKLGSLEAEQQLDFNNGNQTRAEADKITQETLRSIKESLDLGNRPNLDIKVINQNPFFIKFLPEEKSYRLGMKFEIENFGKMPAKKLLLVRREARVEIKRIDGKTEIESAVPEEKEFPGVSVLPGDKKQLYLSARFEYQGLTQEQIEDYWKTDRMKLISSLLFQYESDIEKERKFNLYTVFSLTAHFSRIEDSRSD